MKDIYVISQRLGNKLEFIFVGKMLKEEVEVIEKYTDLKVSQVSKEGFPVYLNLRFERNDESFGFIQKKLIDNKSEKGVTINWEHKQRHNVNEKGMIPYDPNIVLVFTDEWKKESTKYTEFEKALHKTNKRKENKENPDGRIQLENNITLEMFIVKDED